MGRSKGSEIFQQSSAASSSWLSLRTVNWRGCCIFRPEAVVTIAYIIRSREGTNGQFRGRDYWRQTPARVEPDGPYTPVKWSSRNDRGQTLEPDMNLAGRCRTRQLPRYPPCARRPQRIPPRRAPRQPCPSRPRVPAVVGRFATTIRRQNGILTKEFKCSILSAKRHTRAACGPGQRLSVPGLVPGHHKPGVSPPSPPPLIPAQHEGDPVAQWERACGARRHHAEPVNLLHTRRPTHSRPPN
jgi:hypothetical protein